MVAQQIVVEYEDLPPLMSCEEVLQANDVAHYYVVSPPPPPPSPLTALFVPSAKMLSLYCSQSFKCPRSFFIPTLPAMSAIKTMSRLFRNHNVGPFFQPLKHDLCVSVYHATEV
jgi:hypothetical protein